MIKHFGIEQLCSGSGVIDVGGEPGFVATSLLKHGIPAMVVDPSWRLTGKTSRHTNIEQMTQMPGCPQFQAFTDCFDDNFYNNNRALVDSASAIVSLYGDEATEPSLKLAASLGKPCALIPCNECARFFPKENQTYDAYVQACVDEPNQKRGRFELVYLIGAPFSRSLVVQPPTPAWAQQLLGEYDACNANGAKSSVTMNVPLDVLKDMGVLHQVLWKMEQSRLTGSPTR